MARRGILGAVAVLGLVLGACGDDSSDEGSGGSAGTTGGGGGSGAGAFGGSGGGSGSGATGGASGTGGAAGASGSSGAGATGGSSGAGGGGTGGGGTGGGTAAGSVQCNGAACAVPANYCCNHPNQPDECLKAGETCTYGIEMPCDGPEDCGSGQLCCAKLFQQGQNQSYESISCAATCAGKGYRVVCGASGSCPSGTSCGTSDLLAPYRDCK